MTMISHIAVGASGDDRSKQLLQGLPSRVVSEHSRHSPRHVSLWSGFECLYVLALIAWVVMRANQSIL